MLNTGKSVLSIENMVLSVLLILAVIIRLKGITFGFPLIVHPDEPTIVNIAKNIIINKDLNPHFFNYPSLFIYLQAFLYVIIFGILKVFGTVQHFSDIDPLGFYLWGRVLAVLLAMSTIFIMFKIGKLLFDRVTALFAVLFLGVSVLHISNSFMITVDSPLAFWAMLSIFMSVLIYKNGPQKKYYILNGLFIGFAISTKYTGFWVALSLLAAHFLAFQKGEKINWNLKFIFDKYFIIAVALIPIGFLLTTPFALLDFKTFIRDFLFEASHYRAGHPGLESEKFSYIFYITRLSQYFGSIPLLLSFFGTVWLLIKNKKHFLVLALFPLIYFMFLGSYKVRFERNMVVLLPFLALMAGYTCSNLYAALKKYLPNLNLKFLNIIAAVIFIALLSHPVYEQARKAVRHVRLINLPDTQVFAKKWIEAHIPEEALVGQEHYTPPLDSTKIHAEYLGICGLIRQPIDKYDFLITSSLNYKRFFKNEEQFAKEAGLYNDIFESHILLKEFVPDKIHSTGAVVRIYKTAWSKVDTLNTDIPLQKTGGTN